MSQIDTPNDLDHPPEQARTGTRSIPDHQLLKLIGMGSYGEVWLARNAMGEYRAVKIVYRKTFTNERPFERELTGIRKFEPISRSHEGFIDILHVGINETQGYFFYLMELGDDQQSGQKIDPEKYSPKTLDKTVSLQGYLSPADCLKLGLALCQALGELHKRGLVHRDIKPSNIIFVNGVPKLADIGLVADLNEAFSYVGTEGFIPPEGPGSPQADVFSLGKMLYEVSTGRDRRDFPALPTLVECIPNQIDFLELNEVIFQACETDLKKRYQSAEQMRADLLVLTAGGSVKRLKILERQLAAVKRIAAMVAVVVPVLSAFCYMAYRNWQGAAQNRERDVGAKIAYGNQAMNTGDFLGALPYFADALQLDRERPGQAVTHRFRFAAVLRECPKLNQVWCDERQVNQGSFSVDGQKVLLAESQGDVKVVDLQTGKRTSHRFSAGNWLWGAQFSPGGKSVVTANGGGGVCVLDADTLEERFRLQHHDFVESARYSQDGLHIVTACRDKNIRIWNALLRTIELTLTNASEPLFAQFSPDGQLVASGSKDGLVRIWNVSNGCLIRTLSHESWVNSVSFSPDGTRIITTCGDHKARVWEVGSGRQIMPELSHDDDVMYAEYSPDGRMIVTASADGTARLWEASTLAPLAYNPILRNGGRLLDATFSPDGRQIITTGVDGTVRIWDLAGSAAPPPPQRLTFSADASRYLRFANHVIEVCDAVTGRLIGPKIQIETTASQVALNDDGGFLIMRMRNSQPGTSLFRVVESSTGRALGPDLSISNTLEGFALSRDGKRLAIFGGKIMQLWNVPTGTSLSATLLHSKRVEAAIFDPSGDRIATRAGNEITVWAAATGLVCFPPLKLPLPVSHVAFSKNGLRLVGCCKDPYYTPCFAEIWDARDGHAFGKPLNHGDGVIFNAFSPDDKMVVTTSEDFTAIVWNAETGKQIISPVQHKGKVLSASFNRDGQWFVTASLDKTARVWNSETGDPLTPPLQGLDRMSNAVFLEDGRHIVTFETNGDARIWNFSLDEWPVEDLVPLARLLSGSTVTRFGKIPLQESESLETVWMRLRKKYPQTFDVSQGEIEQWHEFQIEQCEANQQWNAAIFHLRRLLLLHPGDPSLIDRLASDNAKPVTKD